MADPDPAHVAKVAALVAHVTGCRASAVRAEQRFVDDLGVDSLAMLVLLGECRRTLGVDVPVAATRQLVHVGDLADHLGHVARRS